MLRGQVGFEIYLPRGYAHSGERYPVVYFLHGLPAGSRSFRGAAAFAHSQSLRLRHATPWLRFAPDHLTRAH